jgi:hypothetical protein
VIRRVGLVRAVPGEAAAGFSTVHWRALHGLGAGISGR